MFSVICVFIDHSSGYGSINHQVAINSTETFKSKLTFEREAQSQGVAIKGYHTDNGIFNASECMDDLLKNQKNIIFIGDDDSHQNGVAWCAIKPVVTMAKTMFMHSALRFPEDTLSTDNCPMAMDYSVWFYDWIPDMQLGLYTIGIWPRSRFDPVSETLKNCHVWVCPTYVLEPNLQKPEVNIPKWDTISQRGFDIGFRKMHSTQVGLVLNFLTGSISPQYCVVFDDMLSTVVSSTAADPEV